MELVLKNQLSSSIISFLLVWEAQTYFVPLEPLIQNQPGEQTKLLFRPLEAYSSVLCVLQEVFVPFSAVFGSFICVKFLI